MSGRLEIDSQLIAEEWRKMHQTWTRHRAGWQDDVAARFEKEFWEMQGEAVGRMVSNLQKLEDLAARFDF